MTRALFQLISQLWLHEPDGDTVARAAAELGLPAADPADLAVAYTDLFLLNVYPYGTAFTDPSGELNGPAAQQVAALYDESGYRPAELSEAGAPDHLGLGIGFLGYLSENGSPAASARHEVSQRHFVSEYLLGWVPICCLALEREPGAHLFYRALAARTRESLFCHAEPLRQAQGKLFVCHSEPFAGHSEPFAGHSERSEESRLVAQGKLREASGPPTSAVGPPRPAVVHLPSEPEEEVGLREIVRFLLVPARCGLFLSRARLGKIAKALGARLPFGSRFEVAKNLFATAGESGLAGELLERLGAEVVIWEARYREWVGQYPAWAAFAGQWLERVETTRRMLTLMHNQVSENES